MKFVISQKYVGNHLLNPFTLQRSKAHAWKSKENPFILVMIMSFGTKNSLLPRRKTKLLMKLGFVEEQSFALQR